MQLKENAHLDFFIEKWNHIRQGKIGSSPANWFSFISSRLDKPINLYDTNNLSEEKVSRQQLKQWSKEGSGVDILTCCISILAWGGMNRKHGVKLFKHIENWLPVAERLRKSELSAYEAYESFAGLRKNSRMDGMGPAYFTKLIYFLNQNDDIPGFIMDQWTAASVNLLFEDSVVLTRFSEFTFKNGRKISFETVTDQNTKENYKKFCACILELAKRLNESPDNIEEKLFSQGRGKGEWRKYVIKQRQALSKKSFE